LVKNIRPNPQNTTTEKKRDRTRDFPFLTIFKKPSRDLVKRKRRKTAPTHREHQKKRVTKKGLRGKESFRGQGKKKLGGETKGRKKKGTKKSETESKGTKVPNVQKGNVLREGKAQTLPICGSKGIGRGLRCRRGLLKNP